MNRLRKGDQEAKAEAKAAEGKDDVVFRVPASFLEDLRVTPGELQKIQKILEEGGK